MRPRRTLLLLSLCALLAIAALAPVASAASGQPSRDGSLLYVQQAVILAVGATSPQPCRSPTVPKPSS